MKKLKIGVFGTGVRGESLIPQFLLLGCEIVALCETRPEALERVKAKVGKDVKTFDSFDEFIETDMDAVLLTNYFHEHAPYAIRCLEKGIHVLSECSSNGTMAEGVALARAARRSNAIYMLAENYPQMLFNLEMQRVCAGGTLGKILYAEGEYNHPANPLDTKFTNDYNYFPGHWRNFLPRTYYVTHSLAPIMRATGATPKRVTAFAVYSPVVGDDVPTASHVGDRAALIMTQNDDGSIFRVTGCAAFGAHHNAYRICGMKGSIENLRGMGEQVMLRYNEWEMPEGAEKSKLYTPLWQDEDEELIKASGHGGGDFCTVRMFVRCIQENKQPELPFDVYSATAMASVAILAHRSMLDGGAPYDIPDFRDEEWCKKYENDTLTPFYGENGEEPTLPCCSHPDHKPTDAQLKNYLSVIGKA